MPALCVSQVAAGLHFGRFVGLAHGLVAGFSEHTAHGETTSVVRMHACVTIMCLIYIVLMIARFCSITEGILSSLWCRFVANGAATIRTYLCFSLCFERFSGKSITGTTAPPSLCAGRPEIFLIKGLSRNLFQRIMMFVWTPSYL